MVGTFDLVVWQVYFKTVNLTCSCEVDKNTAAHISFYQFSDRNLDI